MNSRFIITDSLWNEIKEVIPAKNTKVGRPEWSPRKTLEGIFFVLVTGCQWGALPQHYGNPKTVHGKFMKWCRHGIFETIQKQALGYYLDNLHQEGIELIWFAINASHKKAAFADWASRNPTDRSKRRVKISMITDWFGAPLAHVLGASNKHDSKLFSSTLEALKFPDQQKTKILAGDAAYDSKKARNEARKKNYVLLAATNKRRSKDKKSYQPTGRWIIERTFGWLSWYRSIKVCWCKTKEAFMGFVSFASSVQLFRMGGIFR